MTICLELQKLRRKKVPVIIISLWVTEFLWLTLLLEEGQNLGFALIEWVEISAMLIGLVAGLIAAPLVGVDKEQDMGAWFAARGQSPLHSYLRKFVILGIVLIVFHLALLGAVVGASRVAGLPASETAIMLIPLLAWGSLCGCLAAAAVQVLLAQVFERPAAGVLIAVLASLISSAFPYFGLKWMGWLTPWSLIVAANPAALFTIGDMEKSDIGIVDNPGVVMLGAAAAAVMWTIVSIAVLIRKRRVS